MRNVLKYISIGSFVLIVAIIVLGNIGMALLSKKQKDDIYILENILADLNKNLPIKEQGYYSLNKVVKEGNRIVWEITLDTTFFYPLHRSFLPESLNGGILLAGNRNMALDLDTLHSNKLLKQSSLLNILYYHLFVMSDRPNPLYCEIMNRNFSQTWRFISPFSNRQCECTMDYYEMKETADFCRKQPEAAINLFMLEYVNRQNRLLDIASANADIQMHMTDEGDVLMFYCKYDNSYSLEGKNPISNLREQKEEVQNSLEEDVQILPIFFNIESICNKTSKGFLFRFVDCNKTDSLDFQIY